MIPTFPLPVLHFVAPGPVTSLFLAAFAIVFLGWLRREVGRRNTVRRDAILRAERDRIARDFHDILGQGLTGVLLHADAGLNDPDSERAREALRIVKRLARETLLDSKRVLFELRPEALAGGRLAETLQRMLAVMTEGLPVEAHLAVHGVPRPLRVRDAEHHLFRIAQEAVTNALRHSRARRIDVELDFAPSRVTLIVRDDGAGSGVFRLDELGAEGAGLRGMRERAGTIGAGFTVRRQASGGMKIDVEVDG
jgi:signal transduction histidine kinase